MSGSSHGLRLLAVGVLVLWCGGFLRMETTEKSMVRALLIQPQTDGWTVGLLYQFPEATPDASDAAADLRMCNAEGETLETALHQAEKSLPQTANYRLCEYLLFGTGTTQKTLFEVEDLLQKEPVSRLSARIFFLETEESGEELEQAEALLQAAKGSAAMASRLYESGGVLLPILQLDSEGVEAAKEALLLTAQGETRLTAEETAMAGLLLERDGEQTFTLSDGVVTLRRCVVSVEASGNHAEIMLTGQRKPGTAPVTEAQCQELEALCIRTVRRFWESGADLLRLREVRALKEGSALSERTKNVCPELRADVQMLKF